MVEEQTKWSGFLKDKGNRRGERDIDPEPIQYAEHGPTELKFSNAGEAAAGYR